MAWNSTPANKFRSISISGFIDVNYGSIIARQKMYSYDLLTCYNGILLAASPMLKTNTYGYAGLSIAWNDSGGDGESDFLNYSQWGSNGGYKFYTQYTQSLPLPNPFLIFNCNRYGFYFNTPVYFGNNTLNFNGTNVNPNKFLYLANVESDIQNQINSITSSFAGLNRNYLYTPYIVISSCSNPIGTTSNITSESQGFILEWNRGNGDGASYIINNCPFPKGFFFEIYVNGVFYSTPLIVDYANSYFNTIVNFNQNINLYANLGVNSKTVTPTQLSYLSNVTGDIQSQINNLTSGGASFGSNIVMNNNKIFFRVSSDTNHYIGYDISSDGPSLVGYSGGKLVANVNGFIPLQWNRYGLTCNNITDIGNTICNTLTVNNNTTLNNLTVNNTSTLNNLIANGSVSLGNSSSPYVNNYQMANNFNCNTNNGGVPYISLIFDNGFYMCFVDCNNIPKKGALCVFYFVANNTSSTSSSIIILSNPSNASVSVYPSVDPRYLISYQLAGGLTSFSSSFTKLY